MADQKFKILSIDGGGVRGYLSVSVLAHVEAYLNAQRGENIPLGHRFDLIAGTSVGGLIALGLASGFSAADLRLRLEKLIPKVFGATSRRSIICWLLRPRYNASVLEQELRDLYGPRTLADLEVDTCITSVSLMDGKPKMHKTSYLARNQGRLDTPLVEVGLATAAAPTFFPARSSANWTKLVDGGIAANNPSVVALIDAWQFEGPSKRGTPPPLFNSGTGPGTVLLSVGTGHPGPLPYNDKRLVNGGLLPWMIKPIYELLMLSQSQLADFQAKFLLGASSGKYLRINPTLNVTVKLDDATRFTDLKNKADLDAECEQFLRAHFI